MSHYHYPEDGFPNLEDINGGYVSDDQTSSSSVVRNSSARPIQDTSVDRLVDMRVRTQFSLCYPVLTFSQIIDKLRDLSTAVSITSEIRRYMQDIVVFMRLERGVAGGVSPYATVLFERLTKYVFSLQD
jgi:hypothetical protein